MKRRIMSEEKLPPVPFYTRREKTMIGLKIQQAMKTRHALRGVFPKGRAKELLRNAASFAGVHKNGFLPDEATKPEKSHRTNPSPRDIIHKQDLTKSRGQVLQRKVSPIRNRPDVTLDSTTIIYPNIPDEISLKRDSSKFIMALKPSEKRKIRHPTTKYAQLHKLGLEPTFGSDSLHTHSVNISPHLSPRTGEKLEERRISSLSSVENENFRNLTHTFRPNKKSDKKCVDPVQFQPQGLPPQDFAHKKVSVIPSIPHNVPEKTSPNEDDRGSMSKTSGPKTIEFGEQLKGIIPDIAKSRSENRHLYPMFDHTQKQKEDTMRVRFLDPVLKNFDGEGSEGRSTKYNNVIDENRKRYLGDVQFTPDRRHLELDWRLINQYKNSQRRFSHDSTGMRFRGFSPLLNPPPTAMEFHIPADLESLGGEGQSESPNNIPVPLSSLERESNSHGAPSVNGVACHPVSTAFTRTFNSKPGGSTSKPVGDNDNNRTTDQTDEIGTEDNCKQEVKKVSFETIPEATHEEPVEVIIKIIPAGGHDLENPPKFTRDESRDIEIPLPEQSSREKVIEKTSFLRIPSGPFLNVPRIDVSLEGRYPGVQLDEHLLPDPRSPFVTTPFTQTFASPNSVGMNKGMNSSVSASERKPISNKNIVFVSPALELSAGAKC